MGLFDFFRKNKKSVNNKSKSDAGENSRDLEQPRIEHGVLKSVLNHNIKNGMFVVPRDVHTIISFAFLNCDNLIKLKKI